jgi:hypothetical protein
MSPSDERPAGLNYAAPSTADASPVAAGLWAFLGLGLMLASGCFCIGLLAITMSPPLLAGLTPPPRSRRQIAVMVVLFGGAVACLAVGATAFMQGVRKLLAVGR